MTRIKVLLLMHELSRTGAPKIAVEAFSALKDRLETLTIAAQSGPLGDQVRGFGNLYQLQMPRVQTPRDAALYVRRRLAQRTWGARLERWKPDLIYANSVASLPIAQQLPLPKAPVLLHVHELDLLLEWYERREPRLLREWPTRYIAVAEAVRDALVTRHQIPAERIGRIPEFFNDQEVRALLAESPMTWEKIPHPFVVGGAGRIQWRKGFELWLQTAAYLKDRIGPENIRFVWVGGEDDLFEREMRLTARKLGVDDIVAILPMTPYPLPHYQGFDAFLMTSWEDPFPIVVLENMALGKPVVCVRGSGGSAEQVADTGVVVDRFDSILLGDAIQGLITEPERRQRLGESARERAHTCFTASVVVPRIWEEIQQTIRLSGTA